MDGNLYFLQQAALEKQQRYQREASVGRLWLSRWTEGLARRLARWQERLDQERPVFVPGSPERTY